MLDELISQYRDEIIERTRELVSRRVAPAPSDIEIDIGVPVFLDQLVARIHGMDPAWEAIGDTATRKGGELWRSGVLIGQVVHGYGDVCQAITSIAIEHGVSMRVEDMRTLNMCLDIAIAEAVKEFSRRRDVHVADASVEQLGFLAHELRNMLGSATIAMDAIMSGHVPATGSTAKLLTRSLDGIRDLVTRTLAEVRLESDHTRRDLITVATILEDVEVGMAMAARASNVFLAIEATQDLELAFVGDAQIAASILTNLVQNACKFTPAKGRVTMSTRATATHIAIDVTDECGGLPPGKAEDLFRAFEQRGADRTGLGLGLAICQKGARALGGEVSVVDQPGRGCVFTLTMPRAQAEAPMSAAR